MTPTRKHFDKLSAKKQIERLKKLGAEVSEGSWFGHHWKVDHPSIGYSLYPTTVSYLKLIADKLTKEKR